MSDSTYRSAPNPGMSRIYGKHTKPADPSPAEEPEPEVMHGNWPDPRRNKIKLPRVSIQDDRRYDDGAPL